MIETDDKQPMTWDGRVRIWIALLALVVVALAVSLNWRGNPWRCVLTIPGDDANLRHRYRPSSDMSADGRLLAIPRPGWRYEVWDLEELRLVASVSHETPENGEPQGSGTVQLSGDGQYLLLTGGRIFSLDGKQVPLETGRFYNFVASPTGHMLAMSDGRQHSRIIDMSSGEELGSWKKKDYASVRSIHWSHDSRYLLYLGQSGTSIRDVESGDLLVHHGELDMDLPWPMIAGENSGTRGPGAKDSDYFLHRPQNIYFSPVDAQLAPDGLTFSVLYGNIRFRGIPDMGRVRLYDTTSGALLWDQEVNYGPRTVLFSADGSRIHVVPADHRNLAIATYAASDGRLLFELPVPDSRRRGIYDPLAIGGDWIVANGPRLIDTTGRHAAINFSESYRSQDVLADSSGKHIVEVGSDHSARVWRPRRSPSVAGAWILPETWGIYLAMMALTIGTVVIAARHKEQSLQNPLPKALWVLLILMALSLAWSGASQVVDASIGYIYGAERVEVGGIIGFAFLFMALLGMARLRRGWWIFHLILYGLGLIYLTVLAVQFYRSLDEFRGGMLYDTWHGYPISINVTPAVVMAALSVAAAYLLLMLVLLCLPRVRRLYARMRYRISLLKHDGGFPQASLDPSVPGTLPAATDGRDG